MKGFLLFIIINAVFVVPATAQEKDSSSLEAPEFSLKIANQGSEPRYLLKDKFTPGRYLQVLDTKYQVKAVDEPEPFLKNELTMVADISISKPDKDGVIEKIIKLRSIKSKYGVPDKPVFYMTREQVEKEKPSEKTASSQPTINNARQQTIELYKKLLLSTKIMKIGSDGQVLSVTVLDDELKETDGEKMRKNEKKSIVSANMPDKPVGVGAKWDITGQGETPKTGKDKVERKAEFVSVEQTAQGKAAVIKTTVSMPKMQLKDNPAISSMKISGNTTEIINLEKGYVQKSTQTQIVEYEGKYSSVSEKTTVITTSPVMDKPKL